MNHYNNFKNISKFTKLYSRSMVVGRNPTSSLDKRGCNWVGHFYKRNKKRPEKKHECLDQTMSWPNLGHSITWENNFIYYIIYCELCFSGLPLKSCDLIESFCCMVRKPCWIFILSKDLINISLGTSHIFLMITDCFYIQN